MEIVHTATLFILYATAISAKKTDEFDDLNERATAIRIDTGHSDPNPHYVDIEALRDMSIEAYMKGGNYDDLHEWGVTRSGMSLSLCAAVLILSLIMMCCCHQCQKHLMRDFYKLEAKARKEADARAAERERERAAIEAELEADSYEPPPSVID